MVGGSVSASKRPGWSSSLRVLAVRRGAMIFRIFAISILVTATGCLTNSLSAGADGIQFAQTTSTEQAPNGTGDDKTNMDASGPAQSKTQAQPPAQSSAKNTAAP